MQEYKRLFAYFCFTPALPGCTLPFFDHVLPVNQVKNPFGAMSCEVKLDTLQGSVITLDVPMTATVRELKSMLLEKHPCQGPIERKALKVELLRDSSIIDDAETLDEAGLVGAESPVTVPHTRNEVEAAEKDDIHAQGCFGVKIPSKVTHIGESAFEDCTSLTSISLGASVAHIGESAFHLRGTLPNMSHRCTRLRFCGEHFFG